MKKILVTGGAGFLDLHLCIALYKKSYKVLCVDNFNTGTKKNITLFGIGTQTTSFCYVDDLINSSTNK